MNTKAKLVALGILGILALQFALPVAVMAQVQPLPPSPITDIAGVIRVLKFIVDIVFTVLMIVAIAFILIAAFKYLTAMGDATKVQDAHKMLLYAAVAIALGLIAKGVEAIVRSILQRQA